MADPAAARRRAEEALAKWEDHRTVFVGIEPQLAEDLATALRALLAAGPEAPPPTSDAVRCAWCGAALAQDPDAPHRWRCDRAVQEKCVARGYWYVLCDDLAGVREAALVTGTAGTPSDAVREAAERLWHSLTPPRSTTDDGMLLVRAEDVEAVLRALASFSATLATVTVPAGVAGPDDPIRVRLVPDDAAVREAAEVVRTILTAHDARLSESGTLTYGSPRGGTGFAAAIQWLRRYDAARGGE